MSQEHSKETEKVEEAREQLSRELAVIISTLSSDNTAEKESGFMGMFQKMYSKVLSTILEKLKTAKEELDSGRYISPDKIERLRSLVEEAKGLQEKMNGDTIKKMFGKGKGT